MGRIQSNVGLITGIPITDTVDQLIQVASQPRDLLTSRNQGLQQQQIAVNSLASRLLSLQFDLGRLQVANPFQSRTVTSQNEEVITATITSGGQPALGNNSIQPVQTASSQQFISQQFETLDDIQQSGTFSFGFGGFVNEGISLDELNGGTGVSRGEIRITDLAGNSANIDLSLARTVDDVITAINNTSTINVTAAVNGDRFTLTDNIGGASNLTVQEVNGGSTAADLGLNGISTTSATVTGADVFSLNSSTRLTRLNDGNGVRITGEGITDLEVTLSDGSATIEIDLAGATTLGDVVDTINAASPGNLSAAISVDGNRLEIQDLTGGSANNFVITSGAAASAAEGLGIAVATNGASITGFRLASGLRDTLISSLNGGAGLTLGNLDITDRSGASATVNLSTAETLGELVAAINANGTNVTASINEAGSGIVLEDTVGGAGNLIIANNADGTLTADALGIAIDATQNSVNSNPLNRQTLSEATLLSSLNGGEGISPSNIRITDSNGATATIVLNSTGSEAFTAVTIGDVIDTINASTGVDVTASINSTGDGILLTDNAGGASNLVVSDVNGTLAADLNLTRASTTNGSTQTIDGTSSFSIDLSDIEGDTNTVSLATLNEGSGIGGGDIIITDSQGNRTALIDVSTSFSTVGQLIDQINQQAASNGANVTASINEGGTGIQIVDNTGENLVIEDVNGTAAADLRILSNDNTTDTVNGFGLFSSQSASEGALNTIANRINDLDSGVTASVLNDGTGFRLQLAVDQTGSANEILVNASDAGFNFEQTSAARDALLVVGGSGTPGSGILISSSTNDFNDVINGVDLNIAATSDTPVDITVERSDDSLLDAVDDFVSSYNAIRSDLDDLTDFNAEDFTTGLLFGTNEALRVDTQLSQVVTDRFFGVGSFQSLEEIGLSVDDQGRLSLDRAQLQEAFSDDPQSLQNLFTDETNGIVARFNAAIDSLAGAENGLLTNRNESLQATIDSNLERINRFNESLDRQRETLLLQFFQLEQVIAGLQQNQSALNALQPIAPLVVSRNSNNN